MATNNGTSDQSSGAPNASIPTPHPNAIAPTPLYMTSGARDNVHPEDLLLCIARHFAGDWGDLCPEDRQENVIAVRERLRVFSVYHDRQGVKFYIISEADRSATTCLLPQEY
jgi:hypothetical protein